MFVRAHHRDVALVLLSLVPLVLVGRHSYFGGGTAMALRFGEYRESVDIDFVVSDIEGYRDLRQLLRNNHGLQPILRAGIDLELAREIRADQYGIRTLLRVGESRIKFEIILEARITLAAPADDDRVCGVHTLAPIDMAAEKLLANADRWSDDSVYSRDLIDLAMMRTGKALLDAACAKAEAPYGTSIRSSLAQAVQMLQSNPGRLKQCMSAMAITGVTQAQLWQEIRLLARRLLG